MNHAALLGSAVSALLGNKVRSILTVLGITIGIAAVICVVAIGKAGQDQVEQPLQVPLRAERYADPGQLADLAAAARRLGPRPGGLHPGRRFAIAGAHRSAHGGPAAAAGNLRPDQVLAMQRSAGNTSVSFGRLPTVAIRLGATM